MNKKRNKNNHQDQDSMRLNKYIANYGEYSRRQADRLIEEGKVEINGKVASLGDQVMAKDKVYVEGKHIYKKKINPTYIVLNKPKGIISSTTYRQGLDVISFMDIEERVFPVGRLDKDSEGLILLTNDGSIVNRIAKSKFGHEKEYIVRVNKDITAEFINSMESGVRILGQTTLPATLKPIDKRSFRLTITQGLNRQIRRMCEALGFEVLNLKRIRMMNITLGNLKSGEWRIMGHKELAQLLSLLEKAENEVLKRDDS